MRRYRPVFVKITAVIFMLILPMALLYTYFSEKSLEVIDGQITDNNESRLFFLKNQIESNIDRLSLSSSVLTRDSSITDLQLNLLTEDYYQTLYYQTQVKEKLLLQSLSSNWRNDLSVYLPESRRRISTNPGDTFDMKEMKLSPAGVWRLHPGTGAVNPYYQMFVWDPYLSQEQNQEPVAVFEVRFTVDNIRRMLGDYKQDNPGKAFLLTAYGTAYGAVSADDAAARETGRRLLKDPLEESGHRSLEIGGEDTFISYAYLSSLDAYLVDYVPLDVIHAPVVQSRRMFYLSFVVLALLALIASYLLYQHVQKPVSEVVKGLRSFERGNYSFRIRKRFNNEFDYMRLRFNEMAEQTQHLINDVYEEQNRSRLATLKQLQSQIHPHFLYNCLSFIAACAKAGETETIREMVYHLGDYYRYTTRVENQRPLLEEEVQQARNYLHIYAFRLERLDFGLNIPPDMLAEPVPRLFLQPVVENAIIHGVEPQPGAGTIQVTGVQEGEYNLLQVEDSGAGMTEEQIAGYMKELELPMNEQTGCGLWNVNQRLKQQYGPGSGIRLDASPGLGGLRVTLRWKREHEGGQPSENAADARR
ncbi:two-component sensor histidine kinase [Paenibacillus sp. LMG 31459]|uniref:Two-component sensor histidine kinase n=1 Tax=Paenibacillus phytohabitans TaxID=2654978 RepID=A0ABX1YBE4_9BACL|nr:sensor histidine kinase [Paenibacillus phytohabitans]NOU77526.1 two-component sensor histidine kinase [Paenibacillus phytohabitans]